MPLNTSAQNPNTNNVAPASQSRMGIDRGQCSWFERPLSGNVIGDRLQIVDLNMQTYVWDGSGDWTNPLFATDANNNVTGLVGPGGSGYKHGVVTDVLVDAPMASSAALAVDISAYLQEASDFATSIGATRIVVPPGFAKVLSTVYLREAHLLQDVAYAPLNPKEYQAVGIVGAGIGKSVLIGGDNTMFKVAPTVGSSRTLINPFIERLSLVGPATMPVAVAAAGCTNSSTTVTLASTAGLAVGMWLFDYATSGWKTGTRIESIVPNTSITVRDAFTGSTASYTLTAYTDSCAAQFGGNDADRSNIVEGGVVNNCFIDGFFTGLRLDDCTNTVVSSCYMRGNEYDIEGWFNINGLRLGGSLFQGVGFCTSATTTLNSTTSVTGMAALNGVVSDVSTLIRLGANVAEYTTYGVPADARVLAFPSANSLTLSAATTVSGTKALAFFKGTVLALASGPWRPAYNTGIGVPASIDLSGAVIGQKSFVIEGQNANGAKAIEANEIYLEKVMCFAKLADLCNLGMRGAYVSSAAYVNGAAFINLVGSGAIANRITMDGVDFNGTLPVNVIKTVSSSAKGTMRLDYKAVAVTMNGTTAQIQCGGGQPLNPTSGTRCAINMGAGQTGTSYPVGNSSASVNTEVGGISSITATLNAATVTFNAPTLNGAQVGQVLEFILTQDGTGGRTPAWNAAWKGATLTTSGTAGQKAIVTFKYDGAAFVQMASSGWYS